MGPSHSSVRTGSSSCGPPRRRQRGARCPQEHASSGRTPSYLINPPGWGLNTVRPKGALASTGRTAEYSHPALVRVTACPHSDRAVPDCASRAPTPRGPPTSPVEERQVRIKRTTPISGITRRTRLIAVSTGLVATAVVAIPSATAADATTFSTAQLAATSGSVLKADIPGTAWAIDAKANRVVVTADSTVSRAEIGKIKRQAGSTADAITIKRTPGR